MAGRYDQHSCVDFPSSFSVLQTSPPPGPAGNRRRGRPCSVTSGWLFGTSGPLVPARAHVQCSGGLAYCVPLVGHSSGLGASIPGKGGYEHARLLCSLRSRNGMMVWLRLLTAPDTTSRECGQDSDRFQECRTRTQSKEASSHGEHFKY